MHYPRSKKGFTLVEIIVAILVMSLVFGMTTMLAVSISGYNKDKTHITTCHEEVARVQTFIKNWAKSLDDAFNTNYTISADGTQLSVRSGLYWFKDPNNSFDLVYDPDTMTIVGDFYINGEPVTRTETYTKISSIHFKLGNEDDLLANTARCLITLNDGSVYTLVLQKETSKAGLPVIFNQPVEKSSGGYNEFIFITSADWDTDLNTTEYKNLEDINKLGSFSAAYQYSALSMLRVQVDDQWRMSLEAFTSAYGAKWQVRIFSASGKVAYGMKLSNADFNASSRRLSFFIEEGSILFDGTPVEPMGFTRKPGNVGTSDWHDAAELTYAGDWVDNGLWWIDFNTNIFWDELDTTIYEQVQYTNIRKLYGLSDAFGAGLENGMYIALNGISKHLGAYGDDDVYVTFDNSGPNGTVCIHVGLNAGNLRLGSGFEGDEVTLTFTTLFMLPDGTPIREENTFRCSVVDYLIADFEKSVSASAAGEYFTQSTGSASGDPLVAYEQFHMEYYIHTPWTDGSRNAYTKLETQPSAYGLSNEFYTRLLDNIYIGVDGNEITLRKAVSTYKLSISLLNGGDDRTILRLTAKTADMRADSYPVDLTSQILSIRFGHSVNDSGNVLLKPFCMPNGIPVRHISLARPAADFSASHWLTRQSLSSKISSSQSGGTLYVDFTSNGLWRFAGSSFYQVLSQGRGFSESFINSIKNKLEIEINGNRQSIAKWGVNNFDVVVFENNGRWAMQLQIKNDLVTAKDLTIHFVDGFVGPDGTTLIMPISFVRDGTNSWTGSASSDIYLANRTVSINSSNNTTHTMAVALPSGSFSGTAPFKIYAKVKLENTVVNGNGYASITLDYANSNDLTIATLTADTDGWVSLVELHGTEFQMKKENASIVFKTNNLKGQFTIADLVVVDVNGKILYSMANDTTLYGVGDIKNVDGSISKWSATTGTGVSYPIITRGDSRYVPNRVLRVVVNSGYTGGDASLLISEKQFTDGVTYYVTGRIRANVTGKTSASNAGSNSSNVVVSGAGDNKYYGVPNGEWVALTNADGTPLSFIGGITEIPKPLSTVHRQIGIHTKHDMTYGRMAIDGTAAAAKFGANRKLIVRGYYKVEEFKSVGSGGCAYIGDGANYGRITVTKNQTTWQYFKLEWTTGNTLFFSLYNANGYLRLANVTIEDTSRNVVYDMATDTVLTETYRTDFPWNPGIWYITYSGQPAAMDFIVDAATSATPVQYTHTRTTTGKTLANGSEKRTMSIHSKYGTTNGKMTIAADQFKSKIGSGTYTVRGFYKIESFVALKTGGKYEIGDGASKGMESGSANVTTWNYFELTWSPTTNLNFEFHDAMGYIRLTNLTIEDAKYKVVYDMSTDSALTESYRTSFPWNPSIWYITYFGEKDTVMDVSITAGSTGTPMQYSAKIGSVKRSMGIGSTGNTVNAKMQVYGSKFAAKYGAGTYTVSGYYSITSFNSLRSDADCIIGTGATSGTVHNKAPSNGWTYFTLQWNTSKDLLFEFWYATGYLYLGNLTFIDASGNIDYDLSTDTSLPTGWQTAFPQEPNFWYWGYSGAMSYVDMAIDPATGSSPSRNADGHTETPVNSITDSQVKRSVSIGSQNYLQSGKMIITAAQGTAKFGANKTMIVRGYYKVTNYAATGDNPWWQIGSNADSGHSGHKTGNQDTWKYFKIYWNTSKDLNFELWHCNGYLRLANLTIEDLNGGVRYDLSTDSALTAAYYKTFPVQQSIWYFTNEGNVTPMDSVVTALSSSTPKQYTTSGIVETAKTLADGTDKRSMGIGVNNGMSNGKMVITASQATAKFGANKNMIVRGYYKVTSYTKIADGDFYSIGGNAASGGIISTGTQTTWKYFKLHWNTSNDLNFELYHANGYLYLANLTIETAHDGYLGNVVYDLSTDTNLYKDGAYYAGYDQFPRDPSIWYITREADFNFMDVSITAVKTAATPKQYDEDWDYLKFSMWYATGTMEIADLTIYHYVNGNKVIDYSMATDANFTSDYSRVNTDSPLFTVWRSDEWVTTGATNFGITIDYNGNRTLYDSEFQVPKFTDVVG